MGNNIIKLRFVERSTIFIITGVLSYRFVINMGISILNCNLLGELILIITWGFNLDGHR